VLITKYGPVHGHIIDNRFGTKAQQHLECSASADACPVLHVQLLVSATSRKWHKSHAYLLVLVILTF
jgi:hypothetical protein